MITAFVMLNVDLASVPEAADAICRLDGVTEVYSVTGKHDLIVKVHVPHNEQLAEVVTHGIGKVTGVLASETVIAFQTVSEEILDAGFALGGG